MKEETETIDGVKYKLCYQNGSPTVSIFDTLKQESPTILSFSTEAQAGEIFDKAVANARQKADQKNSDKP